MSNLAKLQHDIDRLHAVASILISGLVIVLLAFMITMALLFIQTQKNSPERELQANAQTTNA